MIIYLDKNRQERKHLFDAPSLNEALARAIAEHYEKKPDNEIPQGKVKRTREEVIRHYREQRNFTNNTIQKLVDVGIVVPCADMKDMGEAARTHSIEALVNGEGYKTGPEIFIREIEKAAREGTIDERVFILPKEFALKPNKNLTAEEFDARYLNLFSPKTKNTLFSGDDQGFRPSLSSRTLEERTITPDQIFGAAVSAMSPELSLSKPFLGFKYKQGTDWVVLDLYQLITGCCLKVISNIAAYMYLPRIYEAEMRSGINLRTGRQLSKIGRDIRKKRTKEYREAIHKYGYDPIIGKLPLDVFDLIDVPGLVKPYATGVRAFSRGRQRNIDRDGRMMFEEGPGDASRLIEFYFGEVHGSKDWSIDSFLSSAGANGANTDNIRLFRNVLFENLPLLPKDDKRSYSAAWKIRAIDSTRQYWMHHTRHSERTGLRKFYQFWTSQIVASLFVIYNIMKLETPKNFAANPDWGLNDDNRYSPEDRAGFKRYQQEQRTLSFTPVPIPRPGLMRIYDILTTRTFIIDEKGEKRSLRNEETAGILGMYVASHPYALTLCADIPKLRVDAKEDISKMPQGYMVKIVKG